MSANHSVLEPHVFGIGVSVSFGFVNRPRYPAHGCCRCARIYDALRGVGRYEGAGPGRRMGHWDIGGVGHFCRKITGSLQNIISGGGGSLVGGWAPDLPIYVAATVGQF